jgi:hypothetical protein
MAMNKIMYFGSDLVSLTALKPLLPIFKSSLHVVCPPYSKPRTPLAALHEYLKQENMKPYF